MIQKNLERKYLISYRMDDLAANQLVLRWPYEMIAMESIAVFSVAYQIDHLLNNEALEADEP